MKRRVRNKIILTISISHPVVFFRWIQEIDSIAFAIFFRMCNLFAFLIERGEWMFAIGITSHGPRSSEFRLSKSICYLYIQRAQRRTIDTYFRTENVTIFHAINFPKIKFINCVHQVRKAINCYLTMPIRIPPRMPWILPFLCANRR